MNPFSTLLSKELRQHGFAFAALLIACAVGYAASVFYFESHGDAGSAFYGFGKFLVFFGTLASLVLGNRLLVSEFGSRSLAYLEALPVARWKLLATKYLLGAAVLALVLAGGFAAATVLGGTNEVLGWQFFLILAAKSLGFASIIYNFTFLMGVFGRYRLFIYGVVVITLFYVSEVAGWKSGEWPPFALVNEQFSFEREEFPTADFWWTLLLAAGFGLSGFALGCIREGDLAQALGEKMSYREKVFLGCVFLGVFSGVHLLEERKGKVPYEMPGGAGKKHPLAFAKTGGPEEAAADLSSHLADEIGSAAEFLGYPPRAFPKIFTARRRDLDPGYFEAGELPAHEGILSRANYTDPEFSEPHFTAWTLRRCLIASTRGRGQRERVRWVLDGFPLWWCFRDAPDTRELLLRRSLFATRGAPQAGLLTRWNTTRNTFGVPVAEAVAWSVLAALEEESGETAVRDLVRAALPAIHHPDFRELFVNPTPRTAPGDLVATWRSSQQKAWTSRKKPIESIPEVTARAWFSNAKKSRSLLHYEFRAGHGTGQIPPMRLRYLRQQPFFYGIVPALTQTVSHPTATSGQEHTMAQDWGREERVAYTGEFDSDYLGCAVATGWKRISAND